ncbi:unnamed protein product [Closterium sp. NIES-53]
MDETMTAVPNDMGNTLAQLMRQLKTLTLENCQVQAEMQQLREFASIPLGHAAPSPAPKTSNGVEALPERRSALKLQKPEPFDPSQRDANVRTWIFMLNNYFAASGVQDADAQQRIEYSVTVLRSPALEWWRQLTQSAVRRANLDGHQPGKEHAAATSSLGVLALGVTTVPTTWEGFEAALKSRFDLVNASEAAGKRLRNFRQIGKLQEYTRRFLSICNEIDDITEAEMRDCYLEGLKPDIVEIIAIHGLSIFEKRKPSVDSGSLAGVDASKPATSTNVEETALEQSSTPIEVDTVDRPVVLLGKFRGVPVKILVDSGASHSFVSLSLVTHLHLEADSAVNFKDTRMVDGTPLHIGPIICKLCVVLGPITVRRDFDSAMLDDYDFIFGRDWLRAVSTQFDWAQGSCSVKVDGEFWELPQWSDGATSSTSIINVVRVRQLVKRAAQIFAIFLEEVEGEEGKGGSAAVGEKAALPGEVSALLAEFADVFPDELPPGLPPSRAVDHWIELEPGSRPPSRSPWAALILLAPKKDEGLRMCIDYRSLNAATVKNRFSVPRVEDLLDGVQGARVFSKIDLRSGYHQIRVFPEDQDKTTFRTKQGLFEFRVLPFDLTNAPFHMLMNTVLFEFLGSFVVVYLGDILIFSKTKEEHVQHLQKVFEVLRKEQLYAMQSKCEFFLSEVEFLGHAVSGSGIRTDPKKIAAGYASIASPLTDLLRKGVDFDWGPAHQQAFEQIKQSLTSSPTLSYPDPTRPYAVVTDASDRAIGALNYPIHDKEALAIIHAYKVWRCYLEGADSVIRTDHCSLRFIKSQLQLSRRHARWMEFMEGSFHYRIEYKPGVRNPADPLTRPSCQLASLTVTAGHPLPTSLFEHGYTVDPDFTPQPPTGVEVQGSVYIRKGTARIWVPAYHPLRQLLLSEAHNVVIAGHFGADTTAKTLSRTYFWPGLTTDVEDYIRSCDTCQLTKSSRQRKAGISQPIPPPDRPWQVVTMDFIMALPRTVRGHDAIFVVVDTFSQAVHFIPTHGKVTSEEAATLFVDNVVRLHGVLDSIISDHDPRFTSKFWKQLFTLFGTRLAMSSAYHLETDGQTECVNQNLEQILRNITMHDATAWDKKLSMAEFAYNNTHHSSTGMSPFFALYGQHPNVPTRGDLTPTVRKLG